MNNQVDNQTFYKKAFSKGKGDAGRVHSRLATLRTELDAVKFDMNELVEEFNETHRAPRVAHLRILNRNPCPIMYWRMPGVRGKQPFIQLFQCKRGRGILDGLSVPIIKMFYVFEEQRLVLNLMASVIGNEIAAIHRYIDGHGEAKHYVVAVQ